MEQELTIFENKELEAKIRGTLIDGEPYFVAVDVCKVLEIQNTTQALKQHLDDDERAILKLGRQGETNVVNEYGLYNLILGSRKKKQNPSHVG